MPAVSRRSRRAIDIWPAFVDALGNLLMVIIFVLMIFVLGQFYLTDAISGRDAALQRLQSQVAELGDLLALERRASADLRADVAQISRELQSSIAERDDLRASLQSLAGRAEAAETQAERFGRELADAFETITADKEKIELQLRDLARLTNQVAALQALKDELDREVAAMDARLKDSEAAREQAAEDVARTRTALAREQEISEGARAQLALLNRQMAALREQLAQLNAALGAAEKLAEEQKVQIASLGSRLNVALAGRVQELARYRSEFFGRLREVLGSHPGIRIVGDRFVFQSEVLFDSASAEIGEMGREQLARLAATLQAIARDIPSEINWVLRVDGHTDKVPISNVRYPSNWELSAARAISVVRFLVAQGIPPQRLAVSGFGEFQPIDEGDDEIGHRRNRRIELKLDQR